MIFEKMSCLLICPLTNKTRFSELYLFDYLKTGIFVQIGDNFFNFVFRFLKFSKEAKLAIMVIFSI